MINQFYFNPAHQINQQLLCFTQLFVKISSFFFFLPQLNIKHIFFRSNSLEALNSLLKKGAKLNFVSTSRGYTPLHIAVEFGNRQTVQRLLNEKSLEIDAKNEQEVTALHIAISRGYEGICRDLLHNGASVSISTKEGNSCLHLAASAANSDIFSAVIQAGM